MEAVRTSFRPEFLNRLDEVVLFNRLDRSDMEQIVDIQMVRVAKRLAERRLTLRLAEPARAWLAEEGWDPVYGARPLKRTIEKTLLNPLAQEILKGRLKEGAVVVVGAGLEGLTFSEAD
jgi:ATP-dependent Clp protease ATP-binding subunit ClpB